jgi:hypothetical protein
MEISEHDKNVFKELGLLIGIAFLLGYVFLGPDNSTPTVSTPSMEDFYDYPLVVWDAYDKDGGACIKIRYAIQRKKTKLYMFNESGTIVHQQHMSMSPYKDGRERIETYVWKLYRTEWTEHISPGNYTVVVGTEYDKRGLDTQIEIL